MDFCAVCGFDFNAIAADLIVPRIRTGVSEICEILDPGATLAVSPELTTRRAPDVWSPLEYAAHVRDLLLHDRGTIAAALAEDTPTRQRMFSDLRVDVGMYAHELAAETAQGLGVATGLFAASFTVLSPSQLERTAVCFDEPHTLLWVGALAVHEVEHHLGDIRAQF